jgi:hypothetical protein
VLGIKRSVPMQNYHYESMNEAALCSKLALEPMSLVRLGAPVLVGQMWDTLSNWEDERGKGNGTS